MKIPVSVRNKKIAVLCGGCSEERSISLRTGTAILAALKKLKLNAVKIDADKTLPEKLRRQKIGFCFIALHGKWGEDGTVQGLCEILKIPHSGSGVLASAVTMNKVFSKIIAQSQNILTAKFTTANNANHKTLPAPFPLVVKPSDSGSAFGVSIIRKKSELKKALRYALQYSRQAIIEEYVRGTEISVPILGNRALPIIEIVPKTSGFYDFKAKYSNGGSEHIIPARLNKNCTEKIQKIALQIHNAFGCKAFSRIDFIVDKKQRAYFLELNSVPGMTETSLFPQSAKTVGISFEQLVLQMIS